MWYDITMHTFGIQKHPKILYMADKESSVWDSVAKGAKSVAKDAANLAINSYLWEAGRKLTFSKEDNALIEKVEKEVNAVKWTPIYTILKSTGMISEDKASLAMRWLNSRWDTNDGREWAIKLLKALEDYKKWTLTILTYSKEKWYQTEELSKYESIVKNDTTKMNTWLMKWFYELRWTKMSFDESTWKKIWLYILSRNWESRLLQGIPEAKQPLIEIWKKEKEKEEIELTEISNDILKKIKVENPKIELLLTNTELKLKADGKTIDISWIISEFEKTGDKLSIDQIEKKFSELAKKLKSNWEALIKEWKDQLKKIPGNPKTLREVGIKNIPYTIDGKTIDISDNSIANADPEKAGTMILAITKYQKTIDKNTKDYNEKNTVLENIKQVLVKIQEWKKIAWQAGQANRVASEAKKHKEKWWNRENFSIPKDEVLQVVDKLAVARTQQESTRWDLKEYGITTLEQAEKKFKELWEKWTLTKDESYLKKLLEQFIRDNITIAREQQAAEKILGKKEAQEIFTETNRFVSGNPTEKYDFKALEKIATLADPESLPWDKNLARMEPWQTLSMDKFMEWWDWSSSLAYSPELASIDIQMNQDGSYNIPLLRESHLSEDQVREYRTNIWLYANIWLSQFIPHIPIITEELRRKWINTSMDGSTWTTEQQKVLKEIYTLLFGKKLETTNLWEVERAFGSSLWNPENMKNAIQHTLKVHKLIGESGQPIARDTLKNWIRTSSESAPNTIDPLVNI